MLGCPSMWLIITFLLGTQEADCKSSQINTLDSSSQGKGYHVGDPYMFEAASYIVTQDAIDEAPFR